MFTHKFAVFFTAIIAAATSVSAASTVIVRPPITAPKAGDVWTIGSQQLVTWDTSSIVEPTKETGLILLGTLKDGNEVLDTGEWSAWFRGEIVHNLTFLAENALASGFPINAGAANVTVPQVPTGNDYIVVRKSEQCRRPTRSASYYPAFVTVFGDSGNISPTFTITN